MSDRLRPTARGLAAAGLSALALTLLAACSSGGGDGGSTTDAVPLAASIQAPTTATAGQYVLLDGTASAGGVGSYAWSLLDPATDQPFAPGAAPVDLIGPDEPIASFLAPDAALTVRVRLEVADGAAVAATTVDVDVQPTLPDPGLALLARLELGGPATAPADADRPAATAFDPVTGRLFHARAEDARVDVLELSPGGVLTQVGAIDFGPGSPDLPPALFPSAPTAVAVVATAGGVSQVLVAGEPTVGIDPAQSNGFLAWIDPVALTVATDVRDTGPAPARIAVTADGAFAVVANEGRPSDDYNADPEGSFTIQPLAPDGLPGGPTTTADFTAFNGDAAQLAANGVRLFGANNPTVGEDLEPEGVALVPGTDLAVASLQENDALAYVDLSSGTVLSVRGLGAKDWRSPALPRRARTTVAPFLSLPELGTTPAGQSLRLGGFGGLRFVEETPSGELDFLAVVGRGPALVQDVDGDATDELVLALPDAPARWVRLRHDPTDGRTEVVGETLLTRAVGGPAITNRPNFLAEPSTLPNTDLEPVDLEGAPVPLDEFGGYFGALELAPDGTVWLADRYRPSLYRFTADGVLLERFVPQGADGGDPLGASVYGEKSLPPVLSDRRPEQGFAALAHDAAADRLYALTRAPLATGPFGALGAELVRVIGLDPTTGLAVSQHAFLLDDAQNRVGDAVWSGEEGVLWIVEHGPSTATGASVRVHTLDLSAGTDVLGHPLAGLLTQTLETVDSFGAFVGLPAVGPLLSDANLGPTFDFRLVPKRLLADLSGAGLAGATRVEGLAHLDDGRLALISDDRSGLDGLTVDTADGSLSAPPAAASATALVLVELDGPGFDASDADGGPAVDTWPVRAFTQPDGLSVFAAGGEFFVVTADEGRPRAYAGFDETARVGGLADDGQGGSTDPYPLDPAAFPDAAALEADAALGRLEVTTVDGDPDDDGDYDVIHAFGGRSFTIRDAFGRVVFDSGDTLARWTLELDPDAYNADFAPGTTDERSDERGVEPEALAVGEVDGAPWLFLACERSGGLFVYDISRPESPRLLALLRSPDDRGPDDVVFVPAADSPTGSPLVVVTYERSGSVAVWEVAD